MRPDLQLNHCRRLGRPFSLNARQPRGLMFGHRPLRKRGARGSHRLQLNQSLRLGRSFPPSARRRPGLMFGRRPPRKRGTRRSRRLRLLGPSCERRSPLQRERTMSTRPQMAILCERRHKDGSNVIKTLGRMLAKPLPRRAWFAIKRCVNGRQSDRRAF